MSNEEMNNEEMEYNLPKRIWYKIKIPFSQKDIDALSDAFYQRELARFKTHITDKNRQEFEEIARRNADGLVKEKIATSYSVRHHDCSSYDDVSAIKDAIMKRDDFVSFVTP
jgi:hypothetical protein